MDINDFIGKPFAEYGRGPDAYDCYGLILAVAGDVLGKDVPDWSDVQYGREVVRQIETEIDEPTTVQIEEPEDWAVVVVARRDLPYHLGIYLHGGVLHCCRKSGVVYQRLSEFMTDYGADNMRYYRWRLS